MECPTENEAWMDSTQKSDDRDELNTQKNHDDLL